MLHRHAALGCLPCPMYIRYSGVKGHMGVLLPCRGSLKKVSGVGMCVFSSVLCASGWFNSRSVISDVDFRSHSVLDPCPG